jgi:oligopeptide/dipeptide ABC transporter ATP-binding protein
MNDADPLLRLIDVRVWIELPNGRVVTPLRGVDLAVGTGERVGIVGESGCGKSTALSAVMGLLPASASIAGSVLLDGEDLLEGGEESLRRRRWTDIAIVFQGAMSAFSPVHTLEAQIADVLTVHRGFASRDARHRVAELLDSVGVPSARARSYPHEFSGGMKQRAALAMALACDPKVLLADEPTTALDVITQMRVLELLNEVCESRDLTLVLVTHDLGVVAQLCDRVAVMYAGEVVEAGPTSDVFAAPRHPYTALLLESTPSLELGRQLRGIPGAPPRLDTPLRGCAFAERCPRRLERCGADAPRLLADGRKRELACHSPWTGSR